MKNKNVIKEVFWLRSIACLAVTFGHALKTGYRYYSEPSYFNSVTYLLYMIVLFGVPVFVFISEFLLSYKYSTKLPSYFLKKRVKVLLVPYIFMSIIYSFFEVREWSINNIFTQMLKIIFLGESTIYFILIIFQFYLLHMFLAKYLNRFSPKKIILVAFIVNLLYLSVFNFIKPPNNPLTRYLWDPGYWMPFVGWIFYFVLGFYCGKNYNKLLSLLRKFYIWVILMPVISLLIMLIFNKYLLIAQNSKRVDMLLFSTCMIFLIIYLTSFIKTTPKIILMISNYSFSIFLLNQFFFLLFLTIRQSTFLNILSYSFITFILSLLCSMILAFLLNKWKFGKYLVGQVRNLKKTE